MKDESLVAGGRQNSKYIIGYNSIRQAIPACRSIVREEETSLSPSQQVESAYFLSVLPYGSPAGTFNVPLFVKILDGY
jgi:hypothetical protein